ncbi:hypothetical protein PanWU01x14_048960 [Parasponia andersonii]|uniref:Uncharacterized protein n=1 Tax=Parasponia andersonii TaxID=3476 RepID=A0A2P5DMH5_PARAD|nr:hypothetical protein PanWU01x14_048960 [Parasponia andersonii]
MSPIEACNSRMFRAKACFLVLAFFGLWLVFSKTQHNMLRHKAFPFLLVHNYNDCEAFGLGFWVEMQSGLSSVPGVVKLVM